MHKLRCRWDVVGGGGDGGGDGDSDGIVQTYIVCHRRYDFLWNMTIMTKCCAIIMTFMAGWIIMFHTRSRAFIMFTLTFCAARCFAAHPKLHSRYMCNKVCAWKALQWVHGYTLDTHTHMLAPTRVSELSKSGCGEMFSLTLMVHGRSQQFDYSNLSGAPAMRCSVFCLWSGVSTNGVFWCAGAAS